MPTIIIDGKSYAFAEKGRNLLDVCVSLGFDLPYFCWHPALHSVGACRQCAVRVFNDEKDTKGWIGMSCMMEAKDGMRISISDPEAVAFRAKVIEWLMVNHPHDCPVCDEGGECHLQDMTVMTGHGYRKYDFKKRTHRNQNLGPFVNHEMNRCIQCYRCVRFYCDFAGGRDLGVFGWHDSVYFGRHEDGVLESEFSGNLVEVCPTGVFTDKTLKDHYARKWDLQTAPAICVHCGLGCNTIPGERYGTLRRVQARFNASVNGYFLCDRGRFGYEFVNSPKRLREAMRNGAPAGKPSALDAAAAILENGATVGIGSPRASIESNFALRSLVGPDRFFAGVPERELSLLRLVIDILRGGVRGASLRDVEQSDAVLILGEDPTNSAPMLDLMLRQAAQQKPRETAAQLGIPRWHDIAVREVVQRDRGPFFIATPDRVKLDSEAAASFRGGPEAIARLGFAVAHELDASAPAPGGVRPEDAALAKRIAAALKQGKRPLVVSGISLGSESVIRAAANVARALGTSCPETRVAFVVPECNSLGLAMMADRGLESAAAACRAAARPSAVVLENDLFRRLSRSAAEMFLAAAGDIVALDHLRSATSDGAAVVLPVATFAEATGTFVNNEGRAQRSFQVYVSPAPVQAAWRWLAELKARAEGSAVPLWTTVDDVLRAIELELPAFQGVASAAPPATFALVGSPVPRQSHRHTGRTATTANIDVHEPEPVFDADAPMSFSMEGSSLPPPPELLAREWAPGWNSVQAVNKFRNERGSAQPLSATGSSLIRSSAKATGYFAADPGAVPPGDSLLLVPAPHIFGSEELSVHARGISELAPKAYLGLNPQDATRRKLGVGDIASVNTSQGTFDLPVAIRESLAPGIACVPVGVGDLAGLALPAQVLIAGSAGKRGAMP